METHYRSVVWKGNHAEGEADIDGSCRTWCRFSGGLELMLISLAQETPGGHPAIWALQDGYGAPGSTPIQGYDWSGIRDSSPDAIAAMFAKAKELLALVPIRWVPCLKAKDSQIAGWRYWHPDCFARLNNVRRARGMPLSHWFDLLTAWPVGESCDFCQLEDPPEYEGEEDSPLAKPEIAARGVPTIAARKADFS